MIELLQSQLGLIQSINVGKQRSIAWVEAGHIYADEIPSLSHEVGAIVGAKVSIALENMGILVKKMLFIDDYNAQSNTLDLENNQSLLSEHGFVADRLIMESSLVSDAEKVIAELEQGSLTEINKHGAVILKKNHKKDKEVVLRKSPEMGTTPACVALDTALYIKKQEEEAGICVTVLHSEWKSQQNAVKKVLKALGKDLPILEVYYTDEGDIEIDFEY